jgi:hypothetical protein
MTKLFVFTPKAELDAKQNVELFVHRCRHECTAFGPDLPLDDPIWDISTSIVLKGRRTVTRVIFSNYYAAKAGKEVPTMASSFLPFAQAYFRYSYALRPTTAWANRLVALRALDAVLVRQGPHAQITSLSHAMLDEARDLILEGYSLSVAAKIAGELEAISDFLMESDFVEMKTRWLRGLSRLSDDGSRVGKNADKARDEKMPSVKAIEAMAYLFCNASDAEELYVGSTLALLHCAPQRINETVRLPVQCEVESVDLEMRPQYGLRLPGSKGFENSVRWIVPTMATVARKAIKNLSAVSEPARKIARWYEGNPSKVYLPEPLEYLRMKELLISSEVSQVLFGNDHAKNARDWCQREKIKANHGRFSFKAIEAAVLAKLPKDFPYAQPGLLFSEALFICRRFEMDATLTTYACLIDYITSDQIAYRIGNGRGATNSIFGRLNLTEDDGSPIVIRSHQLRHYLNTLAQSNAASQIDIAMWSGRADIGQNRVYDHVTSESLLSKAREIALHKNSDVFGGDLNTKVIRIAVRRDEITGHLKNKSAHITDYGMCTHEYSSSPCQVNYDCLNCNELVCVKGDNVKLANIVRLKEETEVLLENAEEAEKDFVHGASRWVVHQRRTLNHAKKLIDILTDKSIPDGAVVKLTGIKTASRMEQAEVERSGDESKAILVRRNKLLERVKRG